MTDTVIGIDLGTTNCCVALYTDGNVEILENTTGDRLTPSFVFFMQKEYMAIVGKFAKKMCETLSENAVYDIKRFVGRKYDDVNLQKSLEYVPFTVEDDCNNPVIVVKTKENTVRKTPEQICTIILEELKKNVQKKLGHIIDKAVITVPAYFNVTQRKVTLSAANKAGFTVLKLLNEPTAAALKFFHKISYKEENYALVYDLGGGTFDVAILKPNSSNVDVVAVDGDTYLGGRNLDNLLVDYVCKKLKKQYNYNPRSNRRLLRRLQSICEDAKKDLSTVSVTTIVLSNFVPKSDVVEIELTRKQFEQLAEGFCKKTINIIDNCLRGANIEKSDIKNIIMSGGACRMPRVQEMLSAYFNGKTLNHFLNPDECVAEGAALQAAMLSVNSHQIIDKIHIVDVVPLSLGANDNVDRMNFAIRRGTPIPTQKLLDFTTFENRQRSITFQIYEGERSDARKNRLLDHISICNLSPAPPGQCSVTLTLNIDQNGILTAAAKETLRDNIKELKIHYTRGLTSESEVKNTLADLEENKEEDERFKRFSVLKGYLRNYCITVKYNLDDKELTDKYRDMYKLCEEIDTKAVMLELNEEDEVVRLTKQINLECQTVVDKYKFEFMP